MKRTLLSCAVLLIAVLTQTVRAQSADPIFNGMYSVIGGTAGASGEGLVQLIDGDKNAKWCVVAGTLMRTAAEQLIPTARTSKALLRSMLNGMS